MGGLRHQFRALGSERVSVESPFVKFGLVRRETSVKTRVVVLQFKLWISTMLAYAVPFLTQIDAAASPPQTQAAGPS